MVLLFERAGVSDVGDHSAPEASHDRSATPRPGQWRPLCLGPSPLRLPRREGQPLRLQTNRRVLLADALAALRRTQPDPRPGQARRVLAWVHGIGRSGRTPSSTTVGARIACLSSFYRFLIRMGLVVSNPCDAIERPRATQPVARGYSADEVRRLLAVVPDTVAGRRDRALLLTFILTGRRRTEVIGLTAGDISLEGETVVYAYRGKGGKRGRRELPRPAYEASCATIADAGLSLESMDKGASLWQAGAGPRGVTGSTFYSRFRRYLAAAGLAPSGLHILRHSAARLRRQAGESVEDVSAFLDHSSLAVTTTYLRRLEGQEDRAWREVAEAIGV